MGVSLGSNEPGAANVGLLCAHRERDKPDSLKLYGLFSVVRLAITEKTQQCYAVGFSSEGERLLLWLQPITTVAVRAASHVVDQLLQTDAGELHRSEYDAATSSLPDQRAVGVRPLAAYPKRV